MLVFDANLHIIDHLKAATDPVVEEVAQQPSRNQGEREGDPT
jgi:hypothetical protein